MSYANTVKLESKVLQFEFNYSQVQFNKNGKYFLRFTIHNHHREDLLPQVQLEQNNSRKKISYREIVSDPVTWDGTEQSVSFNVNSLRYTFPKGFCKNDKNYDVTLTIEALASETAGRKFDTPKVVGEAKFAIYPRTDAPRANLLVDRGENYYKYSGIITLLRPFTKSSISMHCGRISYSVAFREDTDATDREDREVEEIGAKPLPKPLPKPRPSRDRKKPVLPSKEPEPKNQDTEDQLSDNHWLPHKDRSNSSVTSYSTKNGMNRNSRFYESLKSRREASTSSYRSSAIIPSISASNNQLLMDKMMLYKKDPNAVSKFAVLPLIQADHSTATGKIFTELQKFIVEQFGKEKLRELVTVGGEQTNLDMRSSVSLPLVGLSRPVKDINMAPITEELTAEDTAPVTHSDKLDLPGNITPVASLNELSSTGSTVVPEVKHVEGRVDLTGSKPETVHEEPAAGVFFTEVEAEAEEDNFDMDSLKGIENEDLLDVADMWTTTDDNESKSSISTVEEPLPETVNEKYVKDLKVPEKVVKYIQVTEKDVKDRKVPEKVVQDFQETEKDVKDRKVPEKVVKDIQVTEKHVKELAKEIEFIKKDLKDLKNDSEKMEENLHLTDKKSNPVEKKELVVVESKAPEVKNKQKPEIDSTSSLPIPKSKNFSVISVKKTSLTTSDRYKLNQKLKENEVKSDIPMGKRSSVRSGLGASKISNISRATSVRRNEKEATTSQDGLKRAEERPFLKILKERKLDLSPDESVPKTKTESAKATTSKEPKQAPPGIQRSNRNNVREMRVMGKPSEKQPRPKKSNQQPPWNNRITRIWDVKTQSFTSMTPRQISLPSNNLQATRTPETRKNAIEKMRTPSKLRKDAEISAFLERRKQHGKRFDVKKPSRLISASSSSATLMRYHPPQRYSLPNFNRAATSSSSASMDFGGWCGASKFDVGEVRAKEQQSRELEDGWNVGHNPTKFVSEPRSRVTTETSIIEQAPSAPLPPPPKRAAPDPEPQPRQQGIRARKPTSTDHQRKPDAINSLRQPPPPKPGAVRSRKVKPSRAKANRKQSDGANNSNPKPPELADEREIEEARMSTTTHEIRDVPITVTSLENTAAAAPTERPSMTKSRSSSVAITASRSQIPYLLNFDHRATSKLSANLSGLFDPHLATNVRNLYEAVQLKVIFSCMDGRVCPATSQARIDGDFMEVKRATQLLTTTNRGGGGSTEVIENLKRHLTTPEAFMPAGPSSVHHFQFMPAGPSPQQQYPFMPGAFGSQQSQFIPPSNSLSVVASNTRDIRYPLQQHKQQMLPIYMSAHNVLSMLNTVKLLPTGFSTESIGLFGVPNWQTFLKEKNKSIRHLEPQVKQSPYQLREPTSETRNRPILPIAYHQPAPTVIKQPEAVKPYHQQEVQQNSLSSSYRPEVFNYRPEGGNEMKASPLPAKWITAPAVDQEVVMTKAPKPAPKPVAPKWNSSCKPESSKTAVKQAELRRKRVIKETGTRRSSNKTGTSGSNHSTSSGSKDADAPQSKRSRGAGTPRKSVKKSGSSGSSTHLPAAETPHRRTHPNGNKDAEVLAQLKAFHEKRKRCMAEITDAIQREESFFGTNFFQDVPALLPPPTKSGRTQGRHHHAPPAMEDISTQVRERHHSHTPKDDPSAIYGTKRIPRGRVQMLPAKQNSLPIQAAPDRGTLAVKGQNFAVQRRQTIASSMPTTTERLKGKPPGEAKAEPPRITQKQREMLECIDAIKKANRRSIATSVEDVKETDTESEREETAPPPPPAADKQADAPVREVKEEMIKPEMATAATSTTDKPKKQRGKRNAFITTGPSGSEESQASHLSAQQQNLQQQNLQQQSSQQQNLQQQSSQQQNLQQQSSQQQNLQQQSSQQQNSQQQSSQQQSSQQQNTQQQDSQQQNSPIATMNEFLTRVAEPGLAEKIQEEVARSKNMLKKYDPKEQKQMLREIIMSYLPVDPEMATQTSQFSIVQAQEERQKFLSKKQLKTLAEVVEIFREQKANQFPVFTTRGVEWADGGSYASLKCYASKRPTPFEGKYDPIARRYEPVLMSNNSGGSSRRNSNVSSRRSSVASDAGSTRETNLRKAVLNKNRRTSMMSKDELEEKKVKELLYIRMKEKMLEYKKEEQNMRKILPRQLLPEIFAQNIDELRPTRRAEHLSAAERNPILGVGLPQRKAEQRMMMKPIFDKAIQKTREEKKGKRKFSDRPTFMQPSAGTVCYDESEPKRRRVKELVEACESRSFLDLTDYRKRQRDRLRNVNTKPVTPPPPVKEVRSIEVQTSSPIPSANGSDRYYANGINGDGLLEPFSKDQATSTYEDRLNEDVHISISSRDNITSPPQDHQIYKRTRDSPTGYPNNSRIPTLTSFSSAPNAQGIQPPPPPQPQPSNQTTAKKKKAYQAPPPRKIIKKTNTNNENSRNGTQTSSMKNSNNSITPIRHVSKPGYEDIFVAIHGATSLPSCGDGSDPTPFASLKTGTEDRNDVKAVCTTHAAYQPTHSPTWEEAFTLQIPERNVSNEDIVLSVADSSTKDQLISYKIPIDHLEPFHTYHLELVQPTPAIPHGIRMYVTIQRKMSHLQRKQEFGYCALEVTLRDFQHELKNSPGSLLAVARIVPDYAGYKDLMLTRRPFAAGINPQIINFPSPGRHHFIRSSENSQGYPQLSLPSSADRQPDWGHTFLFAHNEAATMFSRRAAVVVEYYPASNMITPVTWAVRSPVGHSVIHLDEDTLQALTSDPGRLGIRIDDVLVQGSNFETQDGPYPSVRLVLRLINTERPDTMVAAGNVEMLPQLDTLIPTSNTQFTPTPQMVADEYFQPRTPTPLSLPPTPLSDDGLAHLTSFGGDTTRSKLLVKEDEFPPDDAIENILPEYSLTPNDLQLYNIPTNSTIPLPRAGEARIQQRQQQPRNLPKQPSNLTTTTDRNMSSVIDQREKELNRYKDAVKRMSHDIVNLRQENLGLKSNNQVLRRDVNESKDNAAALFSYRSNIPQANQFDPSLVDSAELAQELDEVNHKLAKDSLDLAKYKSKVQHLQNQVIKANEREKNYLSDQMTRKQLQDAITDLHKKVRKTHKLEETVLKQESVILKMEDLLKKTQKEAAESKAAAAAAKPPPKLPANEDVLSSLTTQNNRLHNDLQKLKETSDSDAKDLRARLERAENRASSLEQQLVRNAREWAREKQELTVRLQEHRNGIIRKNTNA